jgi:hypothetical protein
MGAIGKLAPDMAQSLGRQFLPVHADSLGAEYAMEVEFRELFDPPGAGRSATSERGA